MALASNPDVKAAYRHLTKLALRAVGHSPPVRHTIRNRMRMAFRKSSPKDFDLSRIRNTAQFFHLASRRWTLEHRVLLSLCHVWWWDPQTNPWGKIARDHRRWVKDERSAAKRRAVAESRDQFNFMIRMLNESMGMCIR